MKLLPLICLAAAPVAAQTIDSGQTSARADTLALTNVTLIDGTGAPPRPGMTVLVHGDRIGGVFPGDEAPIPASAEVLDLSGQYLIPGLINTHVHLPMIAWARDSVAAGLERMLDAGVTTVREMAGDTRLSAEVERAALVEGASLPTILYAVRMAGPTFYEPVRDTDRAWTGYPAGTAPWAQAVTAETDLARAVAMAAGTGATGLKLYTDLDADVVRRLVAEAHKQGLKAWAHGTLFPAGPLETVRAGIDGLSHICFLFFGLQPVVPTSMAERAPFDPDLVDLEGGRFQELMREMRARDVVLDATARNASRNPGAHAFGCTPELLNRSLRAAHQAGVRISTGTDYVIDDGDPDPTLFTEIEYLVDAGVLSPLEAITAATLNGAHAIGIQDRYGTVEVGKVADLVVLSGDPTEDIGALQSVIAVFKGGRQVSRRVRSGEDPPCPGGRGAGWHGLFVGCCFPADEEALESGGAGPLRSQPGGHLIESNTFRYTPNGLRVIGESAEPTVVRDNHFIDVYHAVQINGGAVHVLDNDVGVGNPERVPSTNYPGDAINILPFSSMLDLLRSPTEDHTSCSGNVIARNRIEGYPDGIRIMVPDPRTSCRRNEIRDNTIIAGRARWIDVENGPRITDAADSSIVGVPLRLSNWARAGAAEGGDAHDARIEDNLIEGNCVIGAEGVGVEVLHASGNRIANNTLTAVERRDPFPGNTLGGEPERWREANGSAIWLSPGSDENEIAGNTFEDIAAFAVFLEGDGNRVELTDAADAVRDLGTGNRVSGPDTTASPSAYESRFMDAGGVRLHYLDFGGEGLPVVFVHSEAWDAHTYADFAPRFADRNRVLAVTRSGYGGSEPHPDGFGVEVQARSLVDFLDALEIERAVFAGNASATAELTFLGEHHADRVAGLIYFTGLAVPWLEEHDSDPTRAFEMFRRASPGASDAAERERARKAYRPEHLRADRPTIPVPALAFVARSGTMANERGIGALALVGSPLMDEVRSQMPPSPGRDHLERLASDESYRTRQLEQIEDPEAREYLLRLAADPELQETMYRYHEEVVLPALRAAQERFRRAFADDLRLIRLDVDQVVGYEYRDAPELIEAHIRRFLAELDRE